MTATDIVVLIPYGIMAILPVTFFRRGKVTAGWLLTALPFAVAPIAVVAMALGGHATPARPLADLVAMLAALGSLALLAASIREYSHPPSLWHQDDDTPVAIADGGPHARVRHPLYASFLLALAATVIARPLPVMGLAFVWALVALHVTARREEARLLASKHGIAYRALMSRTGRFVPRLGRA